MSNNLTREEKKKSNRLIDDVLGTSTGASLGVGLGMGISAAFAGTAIGTVFPVVGTVVGAAIGLIAAESSKRKCSEDRDKNSSSQG